MAIFIDIFVENGGKPDVSRVLPVQWFHCHSLDYLRFTVSSKIFCRAASDMLRFIWSVGRSAFIEITDFGVKNTRMHVFSACKSYIYDFFIYP